MKQFPESNETQPNGPVDLTDQSTMFLILEELGITHMQVEWLLAHAPDHADLATAKEQHKEFLEDFCGILNGEAGEDRVIANGWAGERMATHLRHCIPEVIEKALSDLQLEGTVETVSNKSLFSAVLHAYERSLSRLTAREAKIAAAGGKKMSPEEYIQLMAGWSALLCGEADTLKLAAEVVPYP